jgi:vancomycin resistance protein YoaR
MKIRNILAALFLAAGLLWIGSGSTVKAAGSGDLDDPRITDGVFIEEIDVSGMTAGEAQAAVESYVDQLKERTITVHVNDNSVDTTIGALGLSWTNTGITEEAAWIGKQGTVIDRYKDMQQLQSHGSRYDLEFAIDDAAVTSFVQNEISSFNIDPKEPSLKREDGKFIVTESVTGIAVNEAETENSIKSAILEKWQGYNIELEATAEITQPTHSSDELYAVQDVLGTATTDYNSGNVGRTKSLELSTTRLNGVLLYPGEEMSASTLMGERSIEGGYSTAEGYIGTRTEEMIGAGICQTATTLYDAALYAEVTVTERRNHSKTVSYVPYAFDATIYAGADYRNPQQDLKLRNDFDYPIYIEASARKGKCTFTIYGKETRASNRKVEYISTTLEESWPTEDMTQYVEDPNLPAGTQEKTQGSYPKVTATLTKVVTVDGKEIERTVLHTDKYKMAPPEYHVGTGAALPADGQPADQPPAEQPPVEQPPAEQPPVDHP